MSRQARPGFPERAGSDKCTAIDRNCEDLSTSAGDAWVGLSGKEVKRTRLWRKNLLLHEEWPVIRGKPAGDGCRKLELQTFYPAHILRGRRNVPAGAHVIVPAPACTVIPGKAGGAQPIPRNGAFLIFFPLEIFLKNASKPVFLSPDESMTEVDIPGA